MRPPFTDFLPAWVAEQRWYLGKGRRPLLRPIGGLRWSNPADEVEVETWFLAEESTDRRTVYQVPLTYRAKPLPGAEGALIGTYQRSELGSRYVYDAPHDPVFVDRLLELIVGQGSVAGDGPTGSGTALGRRATGGIGPAGPAGSTSRPVTTRVLDGEQSNTSVVIEFGPAGPDGAPSTAPTATGSGAPSTPDPVIVKLFRVLHDGQNPEVLIQRALSGADPGLTPRPFGRIEGTWPDPDAAQGLARGHLALAQEFVPGTRDAWRAAVEAVEAGDDFTTQARAIGATVARMHLALAAALPTAPFDGSAAAELAAALGHRLDWAARAVPALRPKVAAARTVLESVGAQRADSHQQRQRIHGDLHLGQVLDAGPRGWLVIDFEGEPLRPLAQRSEPDLALRDVAGMLRSFDYVAGHVRVVRAGRRSSGTDRPLDADAVRRWARDTRDAFCAGYADVAGRDPRRDSVLLRALELDKAVYEAVYEAGNRPDWLPIPVAAVNRLVAADQPAPPADPVPAAEADGLVSPPGARPVAPAELTALAHGVHPDPHAVLGVHPHGGRLTIRTLRPGASAVTAVLPDGSRHRLEHEQDGVFVAVVPAPEPERGKEAATGPGTAAGPEGAQVTDYRIDVTYGEGPDARTYPVDDPYRFLPTLGEVDLHLLQEGRHEELWTVLGANQRRYDSKMGPVRGTSFAVWAPHARGVRLVGDLNHWDGAGHPMRSLGSSGVWELFVPDVGPGTRYKFEITGADGVRRLKADPMARAAETPPATSSVVAGTDHVWGDQDWMAARARTDPHTGPMSTYEVHLGSWRPGLGYRELAEELVAYVLETGFTHVELMPVMEHPYGPSWGYQVTGYFAPTARFGSPDDFRHLIDALHQAGIGVILDWVPAHFPKDAFALARFDGQALYEHPDPRRGDHPDWGTHVFDVGRPQVRNFLVANALYWLAEFHADGLRVDAVASMLYLDYSRKEGEWLPNRYGGRENLDAVQFLQETTATVYRRVPGAVVIAEESTAWPGVTRPTHLGGLGFGLKWNMGWMHDSLEYVAHEPVHRQWHHHQMTFSLMYAWSENFVLPISHDEVVHGKGSLLRKMPGDRWQQLASVRAYLASMWSHPGKQLLFMGTEFAQESEWADGHGLDWWLLDQPAHRGVQHLVRDLNLIYRERRPLWALDLEPAGFRWIDANDAAGNVFSYLRFGGSDERDVLACVLNFSGVPHHGYRLGLPLAGQWQEVLNSDAAEYGGSGVGNLGGVDAEGVPWHGLPASAVLSLPPLGAVWLAPADTGPQEGG
jgi:1,4-alpha-glucan branching enzyme